MMAKRRKASTQTSSSASPGSTRRRKKHRVAFCPACDARMTTALAESHEPRCPVCRTSLRPVRVAGAMRRGLAGLVDGALLLATAGLLNWGLLAMIGRPPLMGDATGLDAALRLLELSPLAIVERIVPALIMGVLYFALFWAATGRTPGQRLLRLRVVGPLGCAPSALRASVRAVGKLAALVPGGLGWIWIVFDREKRGWHDHLAGTYVVAES